MKALIITLLLSVSFLIAQDEQLNDRFAFLQQIYFENQTGQYNRYLENEFRTFLQKYPNFQQTDQILWMLADVEMGRKKPLSAFIQYLKIVVVFPKSSIAIEAKKKLDDLMGHSKGIAFLEKRDSILNYVNTKHYFESKEEALFDLYNFLFSLNIPKLRLPLLNDLQYFSETCVTETSNGDILLFLKGNLNESLHYYSAAEADFRELFSLYKNSSLCADALFHTAMIDYKHLHKLDEAKNYFLQIINSYPDNQNAPKAQFYLAELYASGLDSLNAGIDNYRLFVDAFPEHPLFRKAFKRLILLLFKEKHYEEATTLIGLNLNKHAQDSTFYALVDSMAHIFEKNFKNYEYAARCYVLLSSSNAQSPQAPYYLYRAARIYAKYMHDMGRAKDICQRLQKHYADTPYAIKCQLLIKKRVKR